MPVFVPKFKQVDRKDRIFGAPWLGHKFTDGEQTVHEFRCWICGKWFNYSTSDIEGLIAKGRWHFSKNRPKHCGNAHCEEWNRRHEAFKLAASRDSAKYYADLYMKLKKKNLVV